MSNIFCFCATIMVARKHLGDTLCVNGMSCYLLPTNHNVRGTRLMCWWLRGMYLSLSITVALRIFSNSPDICPPPTESTVGNWKQTSHLVFYHFRSVNFLKFISLLHSSLILLLFLFAFNRITSSFTHPIISLFHTQATCICLINFVC